jgi:hypothetical protein
LGLNVNLCKGLSMASGLAQNSTSTLVLVAKVAIRIVVTALVMINHSRPAISRELCDSHRQRS